MRELVRELVRELLEAKALPEDPWRYFKKVPGTFLAPVSRLDPVHYRPGNRAEKYMRAAYAGTHKKREPVTLRKQGSRYDVVDGNSTVAVARKYGWEKIPATLE